MSFTVGYAGPDIRSDVLISVEPAPSFSYEFTSNCSPLYDQAIRSQIEASAEQFDCPGLHLKCVDSGALPMTWSARLTAAFCLFAGRPIPRVVSEKRSCGSGLRRTRLYVPANTPKLIPNAPLFKPDAVILDLEESVHADRKIEALAMAVFASEMLNWDGIELMVRVNPGGQGEIDLATLAQSAVATFILPKVDRPEDVLAVSEILDEAGSEAAVVPLVESALGVENAYAIAKSSRRVAAISLGLEDYVADIGATRTVEQTESVYARSRILNAARAAGVVPLASVFPRFHDPVEVEEYARSARMSGYEGIGCIHPNQVEPAHRGFRPSEAEVAKAKAIVSAYKLSVEGGRGVVGVGGEMADLPTYERALRVVRSAEGSGQ